MSELYPHADWVARDYGGVPVENLVKIFELERDFHRRILETESAAERQRQYHELYEQVHALKQRDKEIEMERAPVERIVLTFRRELEGKSVLDVGCGNGWFLSALAELMPHGELWGLDTASIHPTGLKRPFRFLQQDITRFTVPRMFDVAFSHQVFEHIAPADTTSHLHSIRAALIAGGTFIVCLPNRFWGPQDITRILDNTFQGRIPAQGSHLNESSYGEMVPLLEAHGFRKVRTVLPLGAFIPWARGLRLRPWINKMMEGPALLRWLNNRVMHHGKPVFKNPIMLVCEKDG